MAGSAGATDFSELTTIASHRSSQIDSSGLTVAHRVSPKANVLDPKFDVRPSDRLVRQGETARFACKVSGTRPLEVFWFKMNGDELVNDEKYEIYHDDELYYLKIHNTVQRDQGLYLCVISNDVDQNVDSFYLNLRGLFFE
jgi:hypothetical protein